MTVNRQLLDGIVIFTEVVKAGGFSAAAENMGHSTSYISKQVNQLEERLGVRLLNRTTRSIGLTPEGKVYYQQSQQIVSDAEDAVQAINQKTSEPRGTLKISCPVSFGLSYLRPLLGDYLAQYPKISLDMDLNDRQVDLIADGFDAVIRATDRLEDSSLISRRIMRSRGYTVASPEYLKRRGTPTHPSELVNHDCLCYVHLKQPSTWHYTHADGNQISVEVPRRMLCNSAEMELAMVLSDQGITRLPGFNIEQELASGQLVVLFDDYVSIQIDVFVVYPSRKHLSSKVRSFIDFLVQRIDA